LPGEPCGSRAVGRDNNDERDLSQIEALTRYNVPIRNESLTTISKCVFVFPISAFVQSIANSAEAIRMGITMADESLIV